MAYKPAAFGAVLVGSAIFFVGACSDEGDEPRPACPRTEAAFRLEVTAAEGAMPDDTAIVVRYQGSQEERFDLGGDLGQNEDVCCRPAPERLGTMPGVSCPGEVLSDAGAPLAVYCELWTSGIAEVTISGGNYPDVVETLQAVSRDDDCGLETTPVQLVLTYPDGGR